MARGSRNKPISPLVTDIKADRKGIPNSIYAKELARFAD